MHEFMQEMPVVGGGQDFVSGCSTLGTGLDRGDFVSKITVYD
jgi:hypothetical protein